MGRTCSLRDLQDITGWSRDRIKRLLDEGAPHTKTGPKTKPVYKIDGPAFIAWLLETEGTAPDQEDELESEDVLKRRKLAVEIDLKEDQRNQQRGDLALISVIEQVIGDEYARVRTRILGMDIKLAREIAALFPEGGEDQLGDILEIIRGHIHEALEELTRDEQQAAEPGDIPKRRGGKAKTA